MCPYPDHTRHQKPKPTPTDSAPLSARPIQSPNPHGRRAKCSPSPPPSPPAVSDCSQTQNRSTTLPFHRAPPHSDCSPPTAPPPAPANSSTPPPSPPPPPHPLVLHQTRDDAQSAPNPDARLSAESNPSMSAIPSPMSAEKSPSHPDNSTPDSPPASTPPPPIPKASPMTSHQTCWCNCCPSAPQKSSHYCNPGFH